MVCPEGVLAAAEKAKGLNFRPPLTPWLYSVVDEAASLLAHMRDSGMVFGTW